MNHTKRNKNWSTINLPSEMIRMNINKNVLVKEQSDILFFSPFWTSKLNLFFCFRIKSRIKKMNFSVARRLITFYVTIHREVLSIFLLKKSSFFLFSSANPMKKELKIPLRSSFFQNDCSQTR